MELKAKDIGGLVMEKKALISKEMIFLILR